MMVPGVRAAGPLSGILGTLAPAGARKRTNAPATGTEADRSGRERTEAGPVRARARRKRGRT
jgi:hypothetical protein